MDSNPADEIPKRNGVVHPVARDHEGKQIWSVSRSGENHVLNRALMVEVTEKKTEVFDGNVIWDTEPPLVRGHILNPDWLVWCMSTHSIGKAEAEYEGRRRLDFYRFAIIARDKADGKS